MALFIFGLVLFALNSYFGIRDVRHGSATKSSAFTWFAIGVITYSLIDDIIILAS